MTPDGRLVGRLDHIFKEQLDVAEAQIVQETRDAVEVRIVRRPSWSPASERSLMKEIRSRLGDAIRVELVFLDAIPRESNGKFRAVKSAVGREPRDDPRRPRAHAAELRGPRSRPSARARPIPELAGLLRGPGAAPEPRVRRRARALCAASASTPRASTRRSGIRWARWCRAGRRIVLKPNFIRHWNPRRRRDDRDASSPMARSLRAVADYAFLAAGAEGSVAVAEAPQHDCDFERDPAHRRTRRARRASTTRRSAASSS